MKHSKNQELRREITRLEFIIDALKLAVTGKPDRYPRYSMGINNPHYAGITKTNVARQETLPPWLEDVPWIGDFPPPAEEGNKFYMPFPAPPCLTDCRCSRFSDDLTDCRCSRFSDEEPCL